MRFGHTESNGYCPQEDEHSDDDGHAAGKYESGQREHCPGPRESGCRARAHSTCQAHQTEDCDQRPRTD
jgi:hypothetical protein